MKVALLIVWVLLNALIIRFNCFGFRHAGKFFEVFMHLQSLVGSVLFWRVSSLGSKGEGRKYIWLLFGLFVVQLISLEVLFSH